MANVTFYLLEQDDPKQASELACLLAVRHFRQRQRSFVCCADQAVAEAVDELMWQRPAEGFVPHNLPGEGPANGAPVQIGWQWRQANQCQVLINVSHSMPDSLSGYRFIYDLVPADEAGKQAARERYKQYRAAGHQLDTRPAHELFETNHG